MRILTFKPRSGLEDKIYEQLTANGVEPNYETIKLPYRVEKNCYYLPDFALTNKLMIETKGWFKAPDRVKMLKVKEQYPNIEFRFIFNNSKAKLYKGSKTTYGDWCNKHGFKFADKYVPKEWLKEIRDVKDND